MKHFIKENLFEIEHINSKLRTRRLVSNENLTFLEQAKTDLKSGVEQIVFKSFL